jgi:hypothetical protein
MSDIARRGGEATRRKLRQGGLEDGELPPLDGPKAAARWCEIAARAVATGRLSNSEGRTVARLIQVFLRSHDAGEVAERMEALERDIADVRRRGLEAVR